MLFNKIKNKYFVDKKYWIQNILFYQSNFKSTLIMLWYSWSCQIRDWLQMFASWFLCCTFQISIFPQVIPKQMFTSSGYCPCFFNEP